MSLPDSSVPDFTQWVGLLEQKIASIRFGSIQIIVHEGRITQIESTEKIRLSHELPGARRSSAKPDVGGR